MADVVHMNADEKTRVAYDPNVHKGIREAVLAYTDVLIKHQTCTALHWNIFERQDGTYKVEITVDNPKSNK